MFRSRSRHAGFRQQGAFAQRDADTGRAAAAPQAWNHPVTLRLDPFRYDRLKRLVRRFSTTGQNIIQTALDRSMVSLERERERASQAETAGQTLLFAAAIDIEASITRKPKQDSFAFVRPEPTVALTYRATVPMHRWLHRRSAETGMTIQEIINDALKVARNKG